MKYSLILITAVLALGMGAIAADESKELADQQDAEAQDSRNFVASRVCEGAPFSWEDDKTLVCHREQRP
ncbi:hypothetical protein ASF19_19985 [Acidovorax sp. Leaf84]|uniref:hypothetical protein n=1 Tax=Acidovorax sp. Leaf84 TaxID=1736240 RepID=UPI0006F4F908|nr:hypothetical protein [Acidovorax sp. Leaf84]KQO38062.1 hypothetical protein ASF19_19985 [Acidovorax sp. Leaf84]RYF51364.1 MAG: hypothetical protein EOO27_30110 [Comamonadaceae bacterium]